MTTHIETATETTKCDECGEDASFTLVADVQDDNGYTAELSLCELCLSKFVNTISRD